MSNIPFCKLYYGFIVLLHGENNRVTLNTIKIDDLYNIRDKLKKAQIHTNILVWDKPTALLLDYLSTDDTFPEKQVIEHNKNELELMSNNEPLSNYEFRMFVNNHLICLSFECRKTQYSNNRCSV